MGCSLDITERKQVEELLREMDQRKNQFLATLAHELRNPLAPISNGLHILQMPGVDEETGERVQKMMQRQVDHLVRLVDELMDVSRISRGVIELHKDKADLAQILQSAVETSRPVIDAGRHRLEINVAAESIIIEADPVRLTQVFCQFAQQCR